jgi:hypothetical protein
MKGDRKSDFGAIDKRVRKGKNDMGREREKKANSSHFWRRGEATA